MAARITAKLVGSKELMRDLGKLDPSRNRRISRNALLRAMQTTLRTAAREMILPGGKGPPRARILTSRTGQLRQSLGASFSIDKSGLPDSIEGGTHLIYGAFHEFNKKRPRPFLQPALDKESRIFPDIYIAEWKRETGL